MAIHAILAAPGSGGPLPTVASISRDSMSASGGQALTIGGANFQPGDIPVLAGVDCGNVQFGSATSLICTSPAQVVPSGALAANLQVRRGGQFSAPLINAATYYPGAAFARGGNFSSGVEPAGFDWNVNFGSQTGTHAIDTQRHYGSSGFAAHSHINGAGTCTISLRYKFGFNPAHLWANGVYMRWHVLVTQQLLDNSLGAFGGSNAQTKWHLFRHQANQNTFPGWIMDGTGTAFLSNDQLTYVLDNGTNTIGGAGFTPLAETWYEIEHYYQRISGTGVARTFINGKLNFVHVDPLMGTDTDAGTDYWFECAIPFCNVIGPTDAYIGDAMVADGFIDEQTAVMG